MYLGNQAGKSFEIKMDKQKEMEKVEKKNFGSLGY